MGYFPFFVDIEGKKGLVVGGGGLAYHKLCRILPFSPQMTVVAPQIAEEIASMEGVVCMEREFADSDVSGMFFVIAATDDDELNARVGALCRSRSILVNVVDEKDKCSFIFPAITRRGKLTAAVSTEGASPAAAAFIRGRIEESLPDNVEEILDFLAELRVTAGEEIADERLRAAFLREMARKCLEEECVPERRG